MAPESGKTQGSHTQAFMHSLTQPWKGKRFGNWARTEAPVTRVEVNNCGIDTAPPDTRQEFLAHASQRPGIFRETCQIGTCFPSHGIVLAGVGPPPLGGPEVAWQDLTPSGQHLRTRGIRR